MTIEIPNLSDEAWDLLAGRCNDAWYKRQEDGRPVGEVELIGAGYLDEHGCVTDAGSIACVKYGRIMAKQHTQTPWYVVMESHGDVMIATTPENPSLEQEVLSSSEWLCADIRDVHFMVHAANSHSDLLAALKYARRFLNHSDHDTKYVDDVIAKAEF